MGHHIKAIIGKTEILSNIVSDWHTAKQTMLMDNYGFIFLSDTYLMTLQNKATFPIQYTMKI